ncbi:hypothetical protein V5O48_013609 [Marasmius crinis-equi]|uniref:Uncharacterized protein n=1 Tax=Marasmius crinis-equi TaxID=585013 RepID=A0ABR3EZL4_9AGAR
MDKQPGPAVSATPTAIPPSSTSALRQPSSGPSRTTKSISSGRSSHLPSKPKASKKESTATATIERNKFIDVDSPFMPRTFSTWAAASVAVGETFDLNIAPPAGRNTGYALPDPNILVGTKNEGARIRYVTTWLKIRPVMLYRMRSPTFEPLKTSDWRSILGMEAHSTKTDTVVGKRRSEMQAMLRECLVTGGLQGTIDLDHLDTAPAKWGDASFDPTVMPPTDIVQQVLWELFEINFRYELLALDRICYQGKRTPAERQVTILGLLPHFHNRLVPEDIGSALEGFASTDLDERRGALYRFHGVMSAWKGGEGEMPAKLNEGLVVTMKWNRPRVSVLEVDTYETALVNHYIKVFSSAFRRAPLLPHRLQSTST